MNDDAQKVISLNILSCFTFLNCKAPFISLVHELLKFFWLHHGTTIAQFKSACSDPMQEVAL
jgi:hypothetical protein